MGDLNPKMDRNPNLDDEAGLRHRIAEAITVGGGVTSMSKKTGVSPGTLSKYAAKTSTASFTNAAKIAHAAEVSLDMIAFGRSPLAAARIRTVNERLTEGPNHGFLPRPLDIERLELAISTVERGLEETERTATPEAKAGMISAAYEILTEPSEAAVGRILRLVIG